MKRKPLLGALVVILGIFLLFGTLGLFSKDHSAILGVIWPIMIILAGLCFIVRLRLLGVVFLLATIILAVLSIAPGTSEEKIFVQQVEHQDLDVVVFNLNFGAGEFILSSQEQDMMLTNYVKTISGEPELDLYREGNKGFVTIQSRSVLPERWNLTLDKSLPVEMNLSYGAADAYLDFSGLDVTLLDINSGATDTTIIFPTYPTKTTIDTGASDLTLQLPRGVGASIRVQGGALDLNLQGFTRRGDLWYNDWYSERGSIEIDISAGASSIETSFFEARE